MSIEEVKQYLTYIALVDNGSQGQSSKDALRIIWKYEKIRDVIANPAIDIIKAFVIIKEIIEDGNNT